VNIVVAVDLGTSGSGWIVERGARLAARTRGKVDLVYVSEDPGAKKDELQALLATVPAESRGQANVTGGDLFEALVGLSGAYDAMVVGPREPGLFERMLRGHLAPKLISAARCAVLVPRGPDREWRDPVQALVGVNVHDPGRPFELAVRWATALGATLDISVTDPDELPFVDDPSRRKELASDLEAVRAHERALVDKLLAGLPAAMRGSRRHGEGYPDDVLVDLSSEYDVVFVGNRPRPGLVGTLRGSIGEQVVRRAFCDVLTLPSRSAP
jgi:nucleotide-binding universal stress UspA family protein